MSAPAPNSNVGGTGPIVSTHAGAVWAVLAGGVILVALADWAPHLVNGILVLLLTGVVLRNSAVWSQWFQSVGNNA